ncbi:Conidiation protein 6-domain-containing protein [Dichotomopilus funicola]|uniref:Conidiation protein 6-domain-containing protein n=1 Tax=Dichotomopilus funicola TaxID=1934379 RepID=A0AAN6UYN0_9PEZI|nr:Conidiation protein 6-domain-containing protein [Dichotomopilus funicola]
MAEARNRERGLKAALHNPHVSEEAKQHDRELLATEYGETMPAAAAAAAPEATLQPKRRTTGGVEKGAGAASRKTRRASVGEPGGLHHAVEDKDKGNVIRGLKAALKNPHVSDKAKEEDRKKLRELGEDV